MGVRGVGVLVLDVGLWTGVPSDGGAVVKIIGPAFFPSELLRDSSGEVGPMGSCRRGVDGGAELGIDMTPNYGTNSFCDYP